MDEQQIQDAQSGDVVVASTGEVAQLSPIMPIDPLPPIIAPIEEPPIQVDEAQAINNDIPDALPVNLVFENNLPVSLSKPQYIPTVVIDGGLRPDPNVINPGTFNR